MSSEFGTHLKITVFGESHGPFVGAFVTGLPIGTGIDSDRLMAFMKRRAPGRSSVVSSRHEDDIPEFTEGVENGVITGSKITILIKNKDAKRSDYDPYRNTPRPSHADYTAWIKWHGNCDMSGGGPFSGRLTAPLCAAGAIALQVLEQRGIRIGAHLLRVGDLCDDSYPLFPSAEILSAASQKEIPVLSDAAGDRIAALLRDLKERGDSVGGIIECCCTGLPAGLGGPMFDGLEGSISKAVFGIPAVKGIQFGAGFSSASMLGSEHNDPFISDGEHILTKTNNSGGILGGISCGMPLVFTAAVKPTPSISLPQETVDLSTGENAVITIGGRHDPCVAVRAVPVVEAVTAIVLLDIILGESR